LKKIILNIILFYSLAFTFNAKAQKYFIYFTDKQNSAFSIESPTEFLSPRAIERRTKQGITISEDDIPVCQTYVDSLKNMGLKVFWPSKWLNGAIIETNKSNLIDTITRVSFIDKCRLIWQSSAPGIPKYDISTEKSNLKIGDLTQYGLAENQTKTVNGHLLHQKGYEGQGMMIAVLDNGFKNVNNLPSFIHLWDNSQIKASRDFVNPGGDVYTTNATHGTMVLSTMGGLIEGQFKGSAPEADYVLLRSEDDESEYIIEEYNWVIAAEFADSIGADVINSSLGYYSFFDSSTNYKYSNLDGETSISVFGAEQAFAKGMLVVTSAGNEGNNSWKYIITPADGKNVLAVGAAKADSTRASFSSFGPSADGRIKPDVSAVGQEAAVQTQSGEIGLANGTSFSSPITAGFATCLWQALPNLNNRQIYLAIKTSGHLASNPNNELGYGFPDFNKAFDYDSGITNSIAQNSIIISPNPFASNINVTIKIPFSGNVTYTLFNITGKAIKSGVLTPDITMNISGLNNISAGVYILQLKYSSNSISYKIIKK